MELEEIEKDVMLIRYYNVLFYLFFEKGRDDLKMQCLVNRIDRGGTHKNETNKRLVPLSSSSI